jgi:hypothetical protein
MPGNPKTLIEKTLEQHLQKIRPPEDIRDQLDVGYDFDRQAIMLVEIRPKWDDPERIMHHPYAKIRYIKSQKLFKLYWLRASGKWELYEPFPESSHLQELLDVVAEDRHYCFKG